MQIENQPPLSPMPMPGAEVSELRTKLAETRLELRVAIAGLKELEAIYFDYSKTTYDLVEIRAIISTTLRQLGAAKRVRNTNGEST